MINLRAIKNHNIVNSDIDRKIQSCHFEKVQLVYRDMSKLTALLPFLVNKISGFLVWNKFHDLWIHIFFQKKVIIGWHFDGRINQIELKTYEFENRGTSRLIAPSVISGPSRFHGTEKTQIVIDRIFQHSEIL